MENSDGINNIKKIFRYYRMIRNIFNSINFLFKMPNNNQKRTDLKRTRSNDDFFRFQWPWIV